MQKIFIYNQFTIIKEMIFMKKRKEESSGWIPMDEIKRVDKSTSPLDIYLTGEELELHFIKCKTRLNEQQINFCIKYVETLDKVASYKYAYGSRLKDSSANSGAILLLSKPHIKDFIDVLIYHAMQEMEFKFSLPHRIYNEVEKMAFSPDYKYPSQKLEALKMIARAQGLFVDGEKTDLKDFTRDLEKKILEATKVDK